MTTVAVPTSGIKLTDVRISNFRSLTNIQVELDHLTVLVGANNAGKTSFLDAMYAAVGAGRKILTHDDVHLAPGEALPPLERKVTIDIRFRPVDDAGAVVDNFPMGSFWTGLWGPGISQDEEFRDVVAFRTTLAWNPIRGEYTLDRKFLRDWRPNPIWLTSEAGDRAVTASQIEAIAMHYIDAKRDLDDDLRKPGSFWRRLTDNLGLSDTDVAAFEATLSGLNGEIVARSEVLQHLRDNLAELNSVVSADSAGVDIAPVARRLRDLSKGVDVTFATAGAQAFPLTRHGMGTRSLASLLVFRAFASWRDALANREGNRVHTLLALEEPESHLHPQAQRSLFARIKSITGQRIVSTHSPYFAGQAKLEELRLFTKQNGITSAARLNMAGLNLDGQRKLEREVIASRGDLLFARALVLFEGETEEQALPLWAELFWGASIHELGFSFVSVGGQNYFPFIWLARSFGIPWFVFSDGEPAAITTLARELGRAGYPSVAACPNVLVLPDGNDLEAQLIADGYLDAIETAANLMDNPGALDRYITAQHGKLGPTVMGVQPVRDYMSAGGRPRAALDMISSRKTRYAAPIALAITSLPDAGRRIPPKVGEFLGIISADLNITRPAVAGGDAA